MSVLNRGLNTIILLILMMVLPALLLLRQLSLYDSTQTEDWTASPSHCDRFYQVPLTRDRVQFVNSTEALQRCRDVVLQVWKFIVRNTPQ